MESRAQTLGQGHAFFFEKEATMSHASDFLEFTNPMITPNKPPSIKPTQHYPRVLITITPDLLSSTASIFAENVPKRLSDEHQMMLTL